MSVETLNFYQEPGPELENRKVTHEGIGVIFEFNEEVSPGIRTSIHKTYDPGKKTWHVEHRDESENGDKNRVISQDFTQVSPKKDNESVVFKKSTDAQYSIFFRNSVFDQRLESTDGNNNLNVRIDPRYGPIESVTTEYHHDHPHQNRARIVLYDDKDFLRKYALDLTVKPHQRVPSAHFQIMEIDELLDGKEAREKLLTSRIDMQLGQKSIWLPDGTQGMVDYKDGYITTAFWSFQNPEKTQTSVAYPMHVPLREYHRAANAHESADWLQIPEIVPVHCKIPTLE